MIACIYSNFKPAPIKSLISFNSLRYSSQIKAKMVKAVVVLAPGVEEVEFVGTVDLLRRAEVEVIVGGLNGTEAVKCSRDVVMVPDVALSSIDKDSFDAIVLPGGLGGAKAMAESKLIGELLKNQEAKGKFIAAICASPALVLTAHGVGRNKKVTCYPSFGDKLGEGYEFVDQTVVQDGKLITSQGPSTVFDFALKIAENLVGADKAKAVAKGILYTKY